MVSKAQTWTSNLHTRMFNMAEGSLCFWEICLWFPMISVHLMDPVPSTGPELLLSPACLNMDILPIIVSTWPTSPPTGRSVSLSGLLMASCLTTAHFLHPAASEKPSTGHRKGTVETALFTFPGYGRAGSGAWKSKGEKSRGFKRR